MLQSQYFRAHTHTRRKLICQPLLYYFFFFIHIYYIDMRRTTPLSYVWQHRLNNIIMTRVCYYICHNALTTKPLHAFDTVARKKCRRSEVQTSFAHVSSSSQIITPNVYLDNYLIRLLTTVRSKLKHECLPKCERV